MSEKAPVKVKICGVTNAADAELAAQLGAWAVGMVFHDQSPRRCARDEALSIAAAVRRRLLLCGVYVNATLEQLEQAWASAREDPGYRGELAALLRDFGGRPTPLYHARRLSERVGWP